MLKKFLSIVFIMLSVMVVSAQQVTTIEDLRSGVTRGDQYSTLMLGWCYANGEGVDKNMTTAIGFWKQLAEKLNRENKLLQEQNNELLKLNKNQRK